MVFLVISSSPLYVLSVLSCSILQPSFFALGCARAGLDIVERVFEQKQFAFIESALESLTEELGGCRGEILAAITDGNYSFSEQVQLRGKAIALAVKCAHAAVTVSSGAANLIDHPASRVYREALLFTVSGQTQALMQATLENFQNCQFSIIWLPSNLSRREYLPPTELIKIDNFPWWI
ncbi:hypothetical protein H4N54_22020 [Limnospira fusiformis KN01]|uniref:Uncharacterized protein n=4 Tax=Limnospira TaxID=2596745 RepID=A0A9P1KB18_9CYAN|nr:MULTISPECIES: hypothetical protein [Limnospira]MDC0836821.1 hypothetical protein [Limnoraphis robusta]MDY7051437.1 hypothetical protein [Limnospira fusiformis LS22]UWU51383.1 hypothetical protein APLC1_6343 [Arthrospira platensis C1]EDZ95915.1 hypothetical protein AmaxDRAFT_1310 [Limnospira maxima CS-328]ULB45061.1 hypothetical protein H4N54_22020 [Limnospira fusiformis KN01]